MASAITKIVRFKQIVNRWKNMSLTNRPTIDSGSNRRIPAGFLAVYVGVERKRFVIPTQFLNLPVFVGLLNKAEEEFGFQCNGGLVLPCEVGFFEYLIKNLERDGSRFSGLSLDEILKMFSDVGFDSCKDNTTSNVCHVFTPLLQRARV